MSLTREQCEDFWRIADKDGDGELSIMELTLAIKSYNPKLTDEQCANMFLGIDQNGDKRITKQEFINEMVEKKKRCEALCELFKKYDKDGNGTLNQEEIRKLISDFFRRDQVEEILEKFIKYTDSSGDGVVSFDEFRTFFA